MGFFSKMIKSGGGSKSLSSPKPMSLSNNHEDMQVLDFKNDPNGADGNIEVKRDLMTMKDKVEPDCMVDHIKSHKPGDVFKYVSVTGKVVETEEGQVGRLRAFTSPYGKTTNPDLRINGIVLQDMEGSLNLDNLRQYVEEKSLSKKEKKENKKYSKNFKSLFNQPYVQIASVTGEFVPLLSGTADYTELSLSLVDGRMLDGQVNIQSNTLPTNVTGVFEMSCDYCVPKQDMHQIAIKYTLARPILREGFQWGTVSLVLKMCQSDTAYQTPSLRAMAVLRMPYTMMEDNITDPTNTNLMITKSDISSFRQIYQDGDLINNDEAHTKRVKTSSYSKSTLTGGKVGVKGPEHLGGLDGWDILEGMRKPKLEEGIASVSVPSVCDDDSDDYENTSPEVAAARERLAIEAENSRIIHQKATLDRVNRPEDDYEAMVLKSRRNRKVGFAVEDV